MSFTKTRLLIVVSGIVFFFYWQGSGVVKYLLVGWNLINKGIPIKNNNKCCIGILKWQLFWKNEKLVKRQLLRDGWSTF